MAQAKVAVAKQIVMIQAVVKIVNAAFKRVAVTQGAQLAIALIESR